MGILVDQAIVTIENIERHLHMNKPIEDAIEVGAGEIGVAAFVSTLCICIVFVPMFFLSGVARYLFVPLAEAVVLAMIASYILSRTLVPTLVLLLMKGQAVGHAAPQAARSVLQRLYRAFDSRFERVRSGYTLALSALLQQRRAFALLFGAFCVASCLLVPVLGRDFFPSVDAGQIRLHMRAPTGTRIEETARIADAVEAAIRELIPKDQLETVLDNLGVPNSGINLSYSNAGTFGTLDGEILLSLREGHEPTERHVTATAQRIAQALSGHRVLLPAGRHRHADPQLRPAGGDRRAVHRQQRRGQRGAGRRVDAGDPADPRRGGRARAPAPQCAGGEPADGSHALAAARPHAPPTSARTC